MVFTLIISRDIITRLCFTHFLSNPDTLLFDLQSAGMAAVINVMGLLGGFGYDCHLA